MKTIRASIERIYPISESSMARFCALCRPLELPRRHRLITAGELCGHVYFIERGLTRSFCDIRGEEVSAWFSREGDFTFALNELYEGMPGVESVELLEHSLLYALRIEDYHELMETRLDWCNWSRIIHQLHVRRMQMARIDRLSLSSAERYDKFVREERELIQRVNLRYLASYLGMTPQNLSRLRAKLAASEL